MLPGTKKYPYIFSPVQIGKLWAKNRIKYASTETNYNYSDGFVSEKELAYIEAHARGGSGIVTTQGAYTDPRGEGQGYVGMMGIWDDKFIPGLKKMADIIHQGDALACLQLMHCGRVGGINLDYTVGPSVIQQRLRRFRPPRKMSIPSVEECIQEHIDGARRAVEAGYDIIEISGIVGYLISNFVSSYTNWRSDEYGGDIQGRCAFMRKIVEGIRNEIGPDIALGIRLCGWFCYLQGYPHGQVALCGGAHKKGSEHPDQHGLPSLCPGNTRKSDCRGKTGYLGDVSTTDRRSCSPQQDHVGQTGRYHSLYRVPGLPGPSIPGCTGHLYGSSLMQS
jgi:2,4-dienoyl-CoA reductase-like NADH-dependent reductase (Old Yellow Enzyme family)